MASFSCGVEMQQDHQRPVWRSVVGSSVIDTNVLGSSGKNGLEDEESESLPTGFKTVYKIFKLRVVRDADPK